MIAIMDGELLYKAFLAGAKAVSREREHLNKINVFPVPDGDTGNNLSVTLNSLVTVTPDKSFGNSLRAIAQATLAGARGNSGIIFAGFVNGLAVDMGELAPQLCTQSFGKMVHNAVPHAYRAISNPVEGTMITVMRDWAQAVHTLGEKTTDFVELFNKALDVAQASLEATPQKLKVLRDSFVVDSGAKGFVLFLEGFSSSLRGADVKTEESTTAVNPQPNDQGIKTNAEVPYRYCTEAFVTGDNLDIDAIRSLAENIGDSVVVAGGPNGIKIHVHTNDPQDLFLGIRGRATVVSQKVEDMQRQYEMVHSRKSDIALVTDSIADISQDLVDYHQIHMLPLNLLIEGENFLDKLTVKPDRFYGLLDEVQEYPTSSQPNQVYVVEYLREIKKHYKSIIVISVSRELSGTYNVFEQAANSLSEDSYPITVINSRLNSGAQGLLVLRAAEEIERGGSHSEVVKKIHSDIPKSHIYVSVVDFKYMVRGGRVSPLKGVAAKLLNMKPIVSLDKDGKGVAFATAFSQASVTNKILKIIADIRDKQGIDCYSVVHANAPQKAEKFASEIAAVTGMRPRYISEISPIVGLSAGIGAIAVSLVANSSKSD